MEHRRSAACRGWISVFVLGLLAACGGGGGGDGAGTTGPLSPPPQSATGLIPAAPAVGAVLYADAGQLRPLQTGGTWTYQGSHSGTSGDAASYSDKVTQADAGSGEVNETASNAFEAGADTAKISVDAAGVHSTESVDLFGTGALSPLTDLELRSPVRQSDQYTVLDAKSVNLGFDADGDGTNDTADVAAYRLVVGNETVALPNLPSLTALRVDLTILVRAYASSTGQATPVLKFVASTWYASGIGVVRQRLTTPSEDLSSSSAGDIYDEVLTSWDGVNRGFGAMASQEAAAPSDGGAYAGMPLQGAIDAIALSDRAVIRTGQPGATSADDRGIYYALLDLHGAVTKVTRYDPTAFASPKKLVRSPQGFEQVGEPDTAGKGFLYAFDSNATLLSPTGGIPYDLSAPSLPPTQWVVDTDVASSGDGTVWFLWTRLYGDPSTFLAVGQLVLRPFDGATGLPTGPEIILQRENNYPTTIGAKLAMSSGGVFATWTVGGQPMYAGVAAGSTSPVVRTLASYAVPVQGSSTGPAVLTIPTYGATTVVGAVLAGDFSLVLAPGSAGLSAETVSTSWGGPVPSGPLVGMATGPAPNQFVAAGLGAGATADAPYTYFVADYSLNGSALSTQTPQITRFPLIDGLPDSLTTIEPLAFSDRIIVLTNSLGHCQTTVIWRPMK